MATSSYSSRNGGKEYTSFWSKISGFFNRIFRPLKKENRKIDFGSGSLLDNAAWDYGYESDSGQSTSLNDVFGAIVNKLTGAALTPAEREANQFSADEAAKQRAWQEEMSNTSFQRQVADMQAAGVNPALAMSGSMGASTPSGASGSSVTPNSGMSMSDLLQMFMIKPTIEQMKANSQLMRDQGKAALINAKSGERQAGAAERNAGANERNAGAAEMNAETNRMRQEIDSYMAKLDIPIKEATADKLAAETAQIKVFTDQLPERLDILKTEADAKTKQAYASLQSALASVRQAAVAEKLSDSEIALRQAQEYVAWCNGDGQFIANQYLDERQMAEIKELGSRSDFLTANARNMDRNAKVQWMQTITGYTNAACKIADTVFNGVGTFSGMGRRNPIGF